MFADYVSRFVKAALALVSAVVMDYAFMQGRMTRQAVAGIERAAADAPQLFDRVLTSVLNIRIER